ncbi:hypothetical protein CL628_02455 [bacterium]|nr:hypothetical protein [bacterium]
MTQESSDRSTSVPHLATGLAVAIVLAGFVVAATVFSVKTPDQPPAEEETLITAVAGITSVVVDSHVVASDLQLGDAGAPVTIIEYADFECQYCRDWHRTTFPALRAEFIETGVVRYVHRDFPLQQIHENSLTAARAARCAGEQNAFWEYGAALYGSDTLETGVLATLASQLGLATGTWEICMAGRAHNAAIARQSQEAIQIGITATPAFVINGRLYEGALSLEQLSAIIAASGN